MGWNVCVGGGDLQVDILTSWYFFFFCATVTLRDHDNGLDDGASVQSLHAGSWSVIHRFNSALFLYHPFFFKSHSLSLSFPPPVSSSHPFFQIPHHYRQFPPPHPLSRST